MKKVYVVGGVNHYANFINDIELVENIYDADIVIFTGGEDVDPSLYKAKKHPTTYSNINRDKFELSEFSKIKNNQLVIGICRGSQFLCVVNGGLLVQNCDNHAIRGTHTIKEVSSGNIYEITSTHHQMMYPYNISRNNYDILFHTYSRLSSYYEGDKISYKEIIVEPEIVLFHNNDMPKCLCIQGHPEIMRKESPIIFKLNDIINNLLKSIKHED